MKARFLALAALVLGLASCQTEPEGFDVVLGGEVDATICVEIPEAETRAMDSAQGIFGTDILAGDATMRYILEIYHNGELAKERQVRYGDGTEMAFPVRLVPGRAYDFVVWADVVTAVDAGDNHYVTANGLTNITLNGEWNAMDETRDAFTGVMSVTSFSNSSDISFDLIRPFAKLRVRTTDIKDVLKLGIVPTTAIVEYTTDHRQSFNARTVTYGAANLADKTQNVNYSVVSYEDMTAVDTYTLFADYFFADNDIVNFTLEVKDADNQTIGEKITFNTPINVRRNYLTTITGNLLTDANNVEVEIKPGFEQPETVVDFAPINENTYEIRNAEGLKYFRDVVNGNITRSGETFLGKTIILASDIDLGGIEWEPIGNDSSHQSTFRGTFDGQGHTISNFTVNAETGAGLFGMVSPKLICNLNVENATIIGHHYAGAIAGWVQSVDSQAHNRGAIRDCHVKNVTVTLTPDANKDNGDKAGALVGYIVRLDVENCSVDGATVTAYRDCGGVVGHANANSTVKNCSVANTTVVADQTVEYIEEGKAANEGEVVGRISTDSAVENNTVGENVVATVKVNSYEAILEAIAVPGAVVTIGPNPNTEDGSYDMEGKISLAAGVSLIGEGSEPVKILNSWSSNLFKNQAHFTDTYMENIYFDNNVVIDAAIANGNVVFKKCVFGHYGRSHQAVHFDSGNGTVTFDECTLVGRNMLGSSLERVVFNKCTFLNKTASLTGADKWTGVNMWGSYEFNDCVFDTEAHCNVKCDGVVAAFNNCVFNDGRDITTLINNRNNFSAEITFDGFEYVAGELEGPNGETIALTEQDLKDAIAAGNDTILIKGEIDLATVVLSGYNGTIIGADDTAVINTRNFTPSADEAYQLRSNNLTFKNIDVKLPTDVDWLQSGFVGTGTIVFDECDFEGQATLNGGATWIFNDCTFISTESGQYASFVYGATKATFNRCSFSGVDRAAKVYGTGGTLNVEYNTCEFTSSSLNKNGVEIDASYATTTVALNNCTQTAMAGLYALKGSKGTVLVDGVRQIAANSQDALNSALAHNNACITLTAGNYTMPEPDLRGKTITITGTKDVVIDATAVDARDQFVTGATMVFDGVTINFGNVNYMGFANTASLTYKNCKINGLQFLFGENVTFENCEFNSNGAEHSVWTYGCKNITFTGCNFTYGDRCVNCYSDNNVEGGQTVNFTNCAFSTANTASQGAVEINSCFITDGIVVNLKGCTAPAHGELAYVSPWDSTNGAKTTINIE